MRASTRRTPTPKSRPRKKAQPTICVDFDGVIHDYESGTYPKMGLPKDGAQHALQELIDKGYRVVVFTARADTKEHAVHVREWLDYYDVPYHDVTALKVPALVYIDDRAIRFETWPQTLEQLEAVLPPLVV